MPDFTEWTTEQLEEAEKTFSAQIQDLDDQIMALREQMRALDREVNPIRTELEERKFRKARRDPRTQVAGFNVGSATQEIDNG